MSENLIGATTAVFPIRLSVAVASPVDVEWATRDGSAVAGSDYKATAGTVTFLPGETEKQIEVQVYGQAITPEDDKIFFIRLNPPSNAVLVDAILTCTINIIDDQGTPSVAVVIAEGRRGPKGDPGLSAYEQAVLMGYTGTLAEWMDQIADSSKAADRAGDYAISASEDALKAQNAAKNAVFAGVIFPTAAEGVDPVLGVQNGAYFNVRSPFSEHYIDEYQNVNGVAVATGKSYPTSDHFQNISEHTALPFVDGTSYKLNQRVVLTNGDIVKSTIDGNTNDPNVDLTGWVFDDNTVESIVEMMSINNPKNHQSVFVKSKDGGSFTYQSSKSTVNDGVIFYNGWTRITFETAYRSEWVGVTGVEGDDCVPKLKKLFEYVAAKGGGTCIVQDGIHSLDTVHVDNTDGYTEHYAFGMYNNVTIEGTSRTNTVFKLKDNLTAEAPQRWGLFVDNHRSDIVNFTAKNFKVDFNGYNNLCTPTLQPVYVVGLVWDAYKAKGITFDNIWCDKNSTWNSFFIGTRCEDSTIKNCLFTEHSDAIPNNAINDHSTIYINGKNARVENNVFTMPDDVVSYISTGIEGHGENTVCIGNFVNGYGAPFLAASTEDGKHDDVSFIGNIAVRAQMGFAWNSMKGTLKASFIGNPSIKLRKEKAPQGTIRYVHSAIESSGVINSVADRVNSYADVFIQGNYFEQVQPDGDWDSSDVYINACMSVKEARNFHASNNTFKGFKGGVLNVLVHRTALGTVIDLNANTYINCGNSSLQNAYQSAYRLEGLPFVTEEGQAYNLLDKIQVSSDVFLNCVYGVLLGKQDDLTARQIDITGIKYNGSFVPPVAIVKPVDLVSGHTINIEYSTNGFVSAGQTLSDTQGVSGRIDMKHWSSTSVDDFLLQNISYVKTPYFGWNMRALSSNIPSNAVQFGAFPNKDGDRIDAISAAAASPSGYVRSNNVWYKVGVLNYPV